MKGVTCPRCGNDLAPAAPSRWSKPEARVDRLWHIYELGPTSIGALLGRFRGTEAELLAWLPSGPYAWEWQ